jgi:hypothetical protein
MNKHKDSLLGKTKGMVSLLENAKHATKPITNITAAKIPYAADISRNILWGHGINRLSTVIRSG